MFAICDGSLFERIVEDSRSWDDCWDWSWGGGGKDRDWEILGSDWLVWGEENII